jgi:hypothetical protein
MANKETVMAKHKTKETATAGAKRAKSPAVKKQKKAVMRAVKITGGVAFLGLPYNIGQEPELEEKQAEAVVEAGRGVYIS